MSVPQYYCTFQVGCQENREKPEITEPTNPIQCRPHDLALEWQCGLHWMDGYFRIYLFAYGPMTTNLKCTVHMCTLCTSIPHMCAPSVPQYHTCVHPLYLNTTHVCTLCTSIPHMCAPSVPQYHTCVHPLYLNTTHVCTLCTSIPHMCAPSVPQYHTCVHPLYLNTTHVCTLCTSIPHMCAPSAPQYHTCVYPLPVQCFAGWLSTLTLKLWY